MHYSHGHEHERWISPPPNNNRDDRKKRCRLQLSQMYLFNVFHPTTHKSSQPHWKNFLTHSFQTRSAPRLPSSTKTRTIADNTTAIIPTLSIHYTMMREREIVSAPVHFTLSLVCPIPILEPHIGRVFRNDPSPLEN